MYIKKIIEWNKDTDEGYIEVSVGEHILKCFFYLFDEFKVIKLGYLYYLNLMTTNEKEMKIIN